MTEALKLARAVRELLATPDRWTQGAHARDGFGSDCDYFSTTAQSWCLEGAFFRCLGKESAAGPAVARAFDNATGRRVAHWNDTPGRTHAEVLALLDRVIAEMEAP